MNDEGSPHRVVVGEVVGEHEVVEVQVVPDGLEEGLRLDRFMSLHFARFSTRSAAKKEAKKGRVLLDGVPARGDRFVQPGMQIASMVMVDAVVEVAPVPLRILFEDDYLAVVEKPAGLPTVGWFSRTLEKALPFNLTRTSQSDARGTPRPVHRLDAPTGGLILVAKTGGVLADLGRQFQAREVKKRYRALVVGRLEGSGVVELQVDERPATSKFEVVQHRRCLKSDWVTDVSLEPVTGRTHQLRRHLAHLGTPVLGDKRYGTKGLVLYKRGLFLWSVRLGFRHPVTQEVLDIRVDAPDKFDALLEREQRRWENHFPPSGGAVREDG